MVGNRIIEWKNQVLQFIALYCPGATSLRIWLHRMRGVKIGKGCRINMGVIIETLKPNDVTIGNNVSIGIRTLILAHYRNQDPSPIPVTIEKEVFVGPGSIIVPEITLGRGSVVTAKSVVNDSVPPMTIVQGNPAKPIATCKAPLATFTTYKDFIFQVRPLKKR